MIRSSQVFLISQDSELEGDVSFRVGGESLHPSRVNSLDDLVDAASAIAAGCAVVDTTSPQIDPGRLEQLLSTQAIEIPTMVIVRAGDVQNAVRLMKAGATHVLEKRAGGRCLIEQINEQLAGEAQVLRQQMSRNEIRRRLDKLTAGERAVLEGVVAGKPNKSIASQLGFGCIPWIVNLTRQCDSGWRRFVGLASDARIVREVLSR